MEPKKKFIAVIGKSGSGKSTIIRSLTGHGKRSHKHEKTVLEGKIIVYQGKTEDGSIKNIYLISNSPQEEPLNRKDNKTNNNKEKEIFKETLNKIIQDEYSLGLVIAIQPIQPQRAENKLSLEDIIQEVQDTNMFDSYLFVLNQAYNPEYNTDFNEIYERLKIFELNLLRPLDGRRFAFLSARDINQETQLF